MNNISNRAVVIVVFPFFFLFGRSFGSQTAKSAMNDAAA
jgi:hypothetical protein